uniref:Co-chaperone protein p23 n=1 Tax=Aegilops tauschii subsp. strangulata TaxID=200361 RepID=A0A453RUY6_AEGTS
CSRHPEVRWAQRIDKVYITVQLPDAKDAKVNLEPDGVFSFFATAGTDGNSYESKLDLNDKVNVEASKVSVGVRSIFCILEKADAKWWNKLVRDDQKAPHFVKVDWDKWVDEDDDGADVNVDGMDFSNMGGMGGMPGMEGLGGMGGMGGMPGMEGLGGMGGMGGLAGMMGGMGGMGGMGMPPGMEGLGGMGMDDFEDESDDEGEVSKPQDAGKSDAAEISEEVEGKAGTAAQSN